MTPEQMLEKLDRVYDLELEKDSLGIESITRFDACIAEIELIRREFDEIGFSLVIEHSLPMLMSKRHE
jgi:hypothetical protein